MEPLKMTSPVVRNYAKALVELMKERELLDITRETAETMLRYFKNRELTLFLRHPQVPPEAKKGLFAKMLPSGTPQEFLNFLHLIVDRARQDRLTEILETTVRLTILEQGYEIVTIISAQPLTEEEQRTISSELEALWEIQIYPEYRVNPNLLGGIIIRHGDKLYDGSLNGQLNRIKEVLITEELS